MVETVVGRSSAIPAANRCRLSRRLAEQLDKEPGGHVRVEAELDAYYVVDEIRESGSKIIELGSEGIRRIRTDPGTEVGVRATVPDESYAVAQRSAGFHESLLESAGDEVFITCPHGGDAEKNTDVMGRHLCQMLRQNGVDASAWLCTAFDSGYDPKDSFSRWHIEEPVAAIDAYPKLRTIADRRFGYAVGFHLQTADGDTVMIGGQADDGLRRAVAASIRDAIGGYADVAWRYDEFGLTGRGEVNSINLFTKDGRGIQVEMPPAVCRNRFKTVPRAVRDVLLNRL